MRYGSVCSGIEAATVAWEPLGWKASFLSEIEKFPRAVLHHHYPDVPLHGDFTTIEADQYEPIDLLVGGTPCQDFSIAGLRAGITGDRGNLTLEFVRLAARLRPRWIVWENVPGVLSSDGGRAFGSFLGGLGVLGYGFAYRVLDAQFAGLAQRRERVFVVGYLGDWRRAAAVLFEQEGLRWNPPPSRSERKGFTRGTGGGIVGSLCARDHKAVGNQYVNEGKVFALEVAQSLRGEGFDASEDGTGRGTPIVPVCIHADSLARSGEAVTPSADAEGRVRLRPPGKGYIDDGTAYSLTAGSPHAIAFSSKDHGADATADLAPTMRAMGHAASHANAGGQLAVTYSIMPQNSGKDYKAREVDVAQPLMAGGPVGGNQGGDYILQPVQCVVRRLTSRECERLQGFPDGYTDVPYRGKTAADGPRYKALGNSFAVPVVRWIGERIQMIEDLTRDTEAIHDG